MSYSKLRGKIKEKFGRQDLFAEAMEMHNSTLSAKLTKRSDWTRTEMEKACILLGISYDEIPSYFFIQ